MIDWYIVWFGMLWILGLGFLVASLSLANYLACRQKRRFGQALKRPAFRIMIDLGLLFFCLGWSGDVSSTWERIVWAVRALLFPVQTWQVMNPGTV